MSLAAKTAALFRPRGADLRVGPIGIDVSLEAVHFVQLCAEAGKSPDVKARASIDYDCSRKELMSKPHQFRSLIKRALASADFVGRKAVLAMPSGMFRTVSVNYTAPAVKANEPAAILRVMKDRLDGDLQDYVLDFMPVKSRSKTDERLALVAVAEKAPIVNYLELARKAGLEVLALEIGPVAICRLVSALAYERGSRNILVINSGRRASYLTLISGEDLLFDQEVDIGEQSLIRQICDTLEMTESMAHNLVARSGLASGGNGEDPVASALGESGLSDTLAEILKPQFLKLVEEVKRAFLYAAAETRGGAVSQVYLLGSIARWPGTETLLRDMTGVNVEKVPDPAALFKQMDDDGGKGNVGPAPEIAVATGLALHGMKAHG